MDEYIGDFLFDSFQPYHFYCDHSADYLIPGGDDTDSYLSKFAYITGEMLSGPINLTVLPSKEHILLTVSSNLSYRIASLLAHCQHKQQCATDAANSNI
jgi:hypothetical protein